MSNIILPKVYENEGGKYPQHLGKYKVSSSQVTSWKDPEYNAQYILQYFSKIKLPDGIWATFGGETGTFIECHAKGIEHPEYTMLSEEDKEYLKTLDYPENSVYEDEIVLEAEGYTVQGFTDRTELIDTETIGILDYKTGNLAKKSVFYGSDEYQQTTLYCKQKVNEGFKVGYSKVQLLGRKGMNRMLKGTYHPIRLSGESVVIDTPYSEERVEKCLKDIDDAVKEISECYKVYLKYFK